VGLGTQVIGSTLRPASFCGCYGFMPTVGAINRGGSYDGLSQSAPGMIAASLPEAWRRPRLSRPLWPGNPAGAGSPASACVARLLG